MPREEQDEPPFSWQGAAGYSGFDPDRFPPHAPMPGAPPYPAATEPERGPVADRDPGPPRIASLLPRCLLAAGVWAVVAVVLALVTGTPAWGPRAVAVVVPLLLTAAALVIPARRGSGAVTLVLLAFPVFGVLHATAVAMIG